MTTNMARKIVDFLSDHRQDATEFLKRLVLAESPSTDPKSQNSVFGILSFAFAEAGMRTIRIPGRKTGGCLFGIPKIRNKGKATQLLLGHCDTVWPLRTITTMPLEIDKGIMRGPGVYDMKAGLMQMIFAVKALHNLRLNPVLTPLVLITSDEEIGGHESQRHIKRLVRHVDRALVLEPSLEPSGKLKTARKGISNFHIIIRGKAAHAGIAPHEGHSVMPELSHVIRTLYALNDWGNGITVNVGTVNGGIRSNVVAAECEITVDVRVLTHKDAESVEKSIHNIRPATPGTRIEITKTRSRLPMERTPRNRLLWDRARVLGRELGLELEEGISGGASDGNITSQFTATLDGLGAVGDGAHATHEYIDIEKTMQRCALLALLLMEPSMYIRDSVEKYSSQ